MIMQHASLRPLQTDDQARWQAVTSRRRAADGTFVYAVTTTGVYCRPSCGARLARRANVEFFAKPADAERAGFRACKRCRPNEATNGAHADAITRACRLIEAADVTPDTATLAAAAGISPSHFHRVFKSQTGLTPKAYASAHRARRIRDELARSTSVTAAAVNAGFQSSSRFYSAAAKTLGMKPAAFRRGGAGATIRYAVGRCSLGSIIVAASDVGICFIALGDNRSALVRHLQQRFRNADMSAAAAAAFEKTLKRVIAIVEHPAIGLDLPLDIRGTAFQQRVWQELAKIPAGRTRTYREIATALGMPKSTRAVGRACGDNPLAVAIPCHRVVRSDGALAGYRWGVSRKAKLLEREAANRR
jgi:AraC family transcriptional regulator of adaptative response/methylated-DNA-[protein]-cysteine methyltransferase